jgi:TonB family protein
MTSREPSTVRVVFDYEKRLLAEAEAQKRKADVERAAAEAKKAEHDRDLAQAEADKRQADVERAKKEADQAREAAEQAKAQAEKALKEKGVADEAVKQAQKDAEDALKKAKEAEETKKQAEKDTEDALKKAKEADEIKKRAEEEAKGAQEPNKPRPKNQELQAPGVVRPKTPSENRPEKGDVKIGRPVIVPGFTLKTTPRYPVESLRRKERGTVVLDISFDAQGVLEVRIRESSGYRALDEAAKQHVEREATLQKGYAGRLLLPIEFRIR